MDALNDTIVVAQLHPRGQVRALVIGIGPKPWAFTTARAAARCRRAFPGKTAEELQPILNQLQALADAVIAPICDALNAAPVQPHKPSAAAAKRRLLKNARPVPGGLDSGFLGRLK